MDSREAEQRYSHSEVGSSVRRFWAQECANGSAEEENVEAFRITDSALELWWV